MTLNSTLTRRRVLESLAALSIGASLTGGEARTDSDIWSSIQGNPAHTGACQRSRKEPIKGGPLWEVDLESNLTVPVVADDAVIVGTDAGSYVALSLRDGSTRWEHPSDSDELYAGTVDHETVYVPLEDDSLAALDLETGEPRWETRLEYAMYRNRAPIVSDNTVYTADRIGMVYAIDAMTGEIIWKTEDQWVTWTISIDDERVLLADGSFVVALDAETGRQEWTLEFRYPIWAPPTIAEHVYVSLGPSGSWVVALSKDEGELQWEQQISDKPNTDIYPSAPIATNESVIVADTEGVVAAFAHHDGSEKWRHEIDEQLSHHPVACQDTVYLPVDEHVLALSKSSGEVRWRTHVGEGPMSPAIVDDTLVVSTEAGNVLALGQEKEGLEVPGFGIGAGVAGLGGYLGYRWLRNQSAE